MKSFKWIWSYLRSYKLTLAAGIALVLIFSALNMVNPYVSKFIVDKVIREKEITLLPLLIGIMVGATLLKSIDRYFFQLIFENISQNTIFTIRDNLYSRLQELDFEFYDRTRTGNIMARMTGDMEAVRVFTAGIIHSIFQVIGILMFAVIVMFSVNWMFALIMFSITPIIAYVAYKLGNKAREAFKEVREQFTRLNTAVQENISGNRVVKAFAKEDYEIEKFSKENEGFKQKNLALAGIWEKYFPVLESFAIMLSLIMILAGGLMVINGSLTYGELVMFNGLIWALNMPMRRLGWLLNNVQNFIASSNKIINLMEEKPGIKYRNSGIKKEKFKGEVEFRNVGFSYGDETVLKNITFKIQPGQKVAFIGSTGSGKSTIVSLISRFYDSTEGCILIDGTDVKKMDAVKLRNNISIAMQDIFLFSDTIEGNIAYGVPQASLNDVKEVARLASAHDFIQEFPEGYDTIVGERGVGLSGGQKQRIALARALLKDSSILILDDTTSSLDIETEFKIQKTLRYVNSDKTTFLIAHRISSVKDADIIMVFDNGRIVERGTHDGLLEKKGIYYNVYVNQLGDFDEVSIKGAG